MNQEIPEGWFKLTSGVPRAGDKRWTPRLMAWTPVVKGDGFWGAPLDRLPEPVIRKKDHQ